MVEKYRAAVIGCGMIGSEVADDLRAAGVQSHAGAYVAHPLTELAALCDTDPARLQKAGVRWGNRNLYSDYKVLLREQQPEIISICTPDGSHAEVLRCVVETGGIKAVIAEKPLALTAADAREICDLARQAGVVLLVNYTRRFLPSFARLKAWIAGGGLGVPRTIVGYYVKGVKHNATHWFDLSRYFLGEVREVRGERLFAEESEDPTLTVEIRYCCGAAGKLFGMDRRESTIFEMDLIGSMGRMRFELSGNKITTFEVGPSPYATGISELIPAECWSESVMKDATLYAVGEAVECLRTGRVPVCSGSDGVAALAVAEAAILSANSGDWVSPVT